MYFQDEQQQEKGWMQVEFMERRSASWQKWNMANWSYG